MLIARPAHLDEEPDGQRCRLHTMGGISEGEEAGRGHTRPGSLNNWPFRELHTSCYIRRYYWWPSMGTDIELFCSSCPSCQVTKDSNQKPSGLLHSLRIPNRPWQSIGMDFMGPLPMSEGYDYLLVIIDRFTGTSDTYNYMCYRQRGCVALLHRDRETPWSPRVHRI